MENHQNRSADRGFLPFDLIVIVRDICKRWLAILLVVVLAGTGTYIFTELSYAPVYRSVTTFVVSDQSAGANVYSNLSSTTTLAGVFSDLLNSSLLRKSILEELGQSSFDGSIQAAPISETNLLNVTVTASDPRTAFLVSRAIIEHHGDVTYQVVDGITLEVLRAPNVPAAPANSPNSAEWMKTAMLLTALAAVAVLSVFSYTRNAVRSGWEAQEKLDGPFLGELPHEKKNRRLTDWFRRKKNGILITDPLTSFHFVETLHKLRRRLEQKLRTRKVLMVTSLLENEGKSTVAVNLALSLAQKHEKVLLIDCDLHKPACHSLLRCKEQLSGVRDVLSGRLQPGDTLLQDKKSGLYMLLEWEAGGGELLSTPALPQLLAWARSEFQYVILDLPPMAQISDAEGVAQEADASILVVRQNAATAPALNKAVSALESGSSEFLGTVLNDVYSSPVSTAYGSGGYGKYGRYGKYGKYGHYGAGRTEGEEA